MPSQQSILSDDADANKHRTEWADRFPHFCDAPIAPSILPAVPLAAVSAAAFHFEEKAPPVTSALPRPASRLPFCALLQCTEPSIGGLDAPHCVGRVQAILESTAFSALVDMLPVNETETHRLRLCTEGKPLLLSTSTLLRFWLPLWSMTLPDATIEYLCVHYDIIS